MKNLLNKNSKIEYVAFYGFGNIADPERYRKSLFRVCGDNKVLGTILLANEGVNGTISGIKKNVQKVLSYIKTWEEVENLEVKYSYDDNHGFYRMKVKVKKEIVTMGKPSIKPLEMSGEYISPQDWNNLISRDDVLVVDTRNNYETSIGGFKNAVDPKTKSFRDFPFWAEQLKENEVNNKKVVAMYCTGGIRCEKASAYMKKIGFNNVYHLKGGILKYLEEVPQDQSLWEGECFVFDQRVSIKHGLKKGSFKQCYACKMPISEKDCLSQKYVKGISCPNCFEKISTSQKNRFEQRQKQIELSQKKGEIHIGEDSTSYIRQKNK